MNYEADYDRFTIDVYTGDEALTEGSALKAIVADKFSDISADYWVEANKIVVVTDVLTNAKSLGTDILVDVERIRFNDQEFLLEVETNINSWSYQDHNGNTITDGDVFWRGTFADDFMNFSTLDGGNQTVPERDIMEGQAGDDIMVSGAGGDRLIGGLGNDIMDGGANGTTGEEWRDADIAEYQASIDRFSIQKIIFDGTSQTILDSNGVAVFDLDAAAKGDTTIGQIKVSGGTDVKYQIALGETFIVVVIPCQKNMAGWELTFSLAWKKPNSDLIGKAKSIFR